MLTRQLTNNKQPDSFSTTTLLSNVTHIYFSCYFEDDYWKRLAAAFFLLFFPDLAVIGAAEIVGAELIVGASVGLLVLLLFFFAFFSASFFAALAVTGAADTVGAALMVGWFVGLLVLDRFCTRRSVIIMSAASLEAVHAKEDSPKASSATDS